jgi:hypothetical protein
MAKDDYEVILYRLLVYLYAVKKRKILFDNATFREAVRKNVGNDQYFYDIINMAQGEGLIEGATFTTAWRSDKIMTSEIRDLGITANGIRYLKDNSKMHQIGENMKCGADMIADLASIAGLFAGI